MKCKQCGEKNTIKVVKDLNGNTEQYICSACGCTATDIKDIQDGECILVAEPSAYIFKKLWVTPNNIFIKVKTLSGNKFYIKKEGTIYSQIKYTDFDTFEYDILENSEIDFQKVLKMILK